MAILKSEAAFQCESERVTSNLFFQKLFAHGCILLVSSNLKSLGIYVIMARLFGIEVFAFPFGFWP